MALNPEMRASDADRDRVTEALREHAAQGRITMDELHERIDATYAARTIGELQAITADLPEEDLYALPVPATRSHPPVFPGQTTLDRFGGGRLQQNWYAYASVNAVCVTIWLITSVVAGQLIAPWFLWVAGPWGAVLIMRTLLGSPPGRDR